MPFRLTFGREAVVNGRPVSQRARFALNVLQGNADPKEKVLAERALNHMLLALQRMDEDYLRAYPQTPRIYQSGIHYMEEPPGQEEWQDVATIRRMGYGDCEDLACWLAAERVVKDGVPAQAVFMNMGKRPDGATLYHIVVRHPDGRTEDPSRVLGMR